MFFITILTIFALITNSKYRYFEFFRLGIFYVECLVYTLLLKTLISEKIRVRAGAVCAGGGLGGISYWILISYINYVITSIWLYYLLAKKLFFITQFYKFSIHGFNNYYISSFKVFSRYNIYHDVWFITQHVIRGRSRLWRI